MCEASCCLSVTYLLFQIQLDPTEHAHGSEIGREAQCLGNGCKGCGQVLPPGCGLFPPLGLEEGQ